MKTHAIFFCAGIALAAILPARLAASVAYGSINNFDTVNDTGVEAHGFEIELDDCHSTDISYTFDWNHYGVPGITEDNSIAGHPRTIIRWASKKNPDGTWAAYTAIPNPAVPILPTDGHQFTNPSVNFGGEHFGTGFLVQPSAVRYHWLIDNGAGTLVAGAPVQVSTPSFTYIPPLPPPAPGDPAVPAQVVAEIKPPEPAQPEDVVPPEKEFGAAVWVKEIRTTSHNGNEVELRNLISDDPDDPADVNWANGEPDEVEVEWQILQKDYNKGADGANALLKGAAEALPDGDEVVTRRYEFYKYVGPVDTETDEAMAQNVGLDDIHGDGIKTINGVEVDLSTVVVVGDFIGSQMAAYDVAATVGLIDHLQDGNENEPYPDRRVVIAGSAPFTATCSGDLPPGLVFDPVTGILGGTPTASGTFNVTINAIDGVGPDVSKTYTLQIAATGVEMPPQYFVDTTVAAPGGGFTSGDGAFAFDAAAVLTATPQIGYAFAGWSENGKLVNTHSSFTLTMNINHSLVATFIPAPVMALPQPVPDTFRITWPVNPPGWILQESPDMSPGSWIPSPQAIVETGGEKQMTILNPAGKRYFRLAHP